MDKLMMQREGFRDDSRGDAYALLYSFRFQLRDRPGDVRVDPPRRQQPQDLGGKVLPTQEEFNSPSNLAGITRRREFRASDIDENDPNNDHPSFLSISL